MYDFPLLRLPPPEVRKLPSGAGFRPSRPHHPDRARQGERLGPVFDRLAALLNREGGPLVLHDDPGALAPERVIVFEVAGSIRDFAAACARIPGLEYIAEHHLQIEPDEDFWIVDTRKGREGQRREDRLVAGHVYAAMPDLRALRDLLGLWKHYLSGAKARSGFGKWFDLFRNLRDVRPWGPRDRLPDDMREMIRQELEIRPHGPITLEIELWRRGKADDRKQGGGELARVMKEAGGCMLDHASIPPIAYEAALVRLPRGEVVRMLDGEMVDLIVCDDIMFVRPQCSPPLPPADERDTAEDFPAGPFPDPAEPPIAALLDGVPVQRHQLLDERIVVDDPDGLEDRSPVSARSHGTAMASLILHGDRGQPEAPLSRLLHVHPVMYAPNDGIRKETFHPDRLVVDTIYRAVVRMKEGEGSARPTAPHVFVVNLSLGDNQRPYAGWISPWARLLDYLAHRYDVLFVVSAGNIGGPLSIRRFDKAREFENAPSRLREDAILDGLGEQRSKRTLLSPSEALNVVTVGAAHEDAGSAVASDLVGAMFQPYRHAALPNVSSAMGLGHCKAIKPDILMPGGRELVSTSLRGDGCSIQPRPPTRNFGVRAASPDEKGRLDRERKHGGTSVAAALATRAAHRLFDALMDSGNGKVLGDADPAYYGVVVRALLVHTASWPEDVASRLESLYGPQGRGKKPARLDNVARLIGYGVPRTDHAVTCTPERATLVGYGKIRKNQVAVCRLPLPESLRGLASPRTITLTLAWFSPVNVRNVDYRMARLEFRRGPEESLATARVKHQPSHRSVRCGTLCHERLDGFKAVRWIQNGNLDIGITCKESAGTLEDRVRYGLAVTIEAAKGIPVYQEIGARLAVRARI